MTFLSIDFETRATVDLRSSGVYPYAAHPHTDIWCMAWALEGEEPEIWTPADAVHGKECAVRLMKDGCTCKASAAGLPWPVYRHITDGGEIRAWNAAFERIVWHEIMVKRYGAPRVALEKWVCSAAEAAAMALPRSLDECARVTGVSQQKDDAGHRLMLQMTRPRRVEPDGSPVWWDVPEKTARLFDYCKQDVRTEQAIVKVLRRLEPRERELYLLDQRINDRGILIDRPLVVAAKEIAGEGIERANATLDALTAGTVGSVTNHADLRRWLAAEGVATESVDKAAVAELLGGDVSPRVREVLETRADAGRSSIAKLDSMLEVAGDDDRLRGLLLFHGAATGRWSGRLVQPQNFPRGEIADIEAYIDLVLAGDYDALNLFHHPVVVVSSLLRGMLRATPGCEFLAADFSAIEARVLNWLAGQTDIVALFAAGEDVYKHNAVKLYRIPLAQVQKFPHRQTGKFQELGCGYGMGWKKAISAAKSAYGLVLDEAQAQEIVQSYRDSHAAVVDFWAEVNAAALRAVEQPGSVQIVGALRNLKLTKQGAYLYLVLPSGRPLVYAAPRIVERPTPWGDTRPAIEVSAVDPYTRKWGRVALYGGLLVENIVQAVSRDLMAEAMLRCEARGYPVVLTVHDEVVCEVPAGVGSVAALEAILCELPAWAAGCPIAAEGWRGQRYRK